MNLTLSKTGAGIAVRLSRDEFDNLAACGSYVSMQHLDAQPVVVAIIIEEPTDVD